MRGSIKRVEVHFDTLGSLPTTHASQGSDMGLFGGLLGYDAADERLPESDRYLREAGIELSFQYVELRDPHPNTYRLTLENEWGRRELVAISTGGGMMEVIEVDGLPVSIFGDYDETLAWFQSERPPEPAGSDSEKGRQALAEDLGVDDVAIQSTEQGFLVQIRSQQPVDQKRVESAFPDHHLLHLDHLTAVLPVRSRCGVAVPFQSCEAMLAGEGNGRRPLWQLAVQYESERSGLNESQLVDRMAGILRILRQSCQQGLQGTEYEDRVLGYQSGQFQSALQQGKLLQAGLLNDAVMRTTALMEVKSSMGVIVAAPTAGACAAFPAICLAAGEQLELTDDQIARSMLAGGLIGVFIATHWSFAAEVGGCQAEGGSAAAMSAATLVDMMGGNALRATGAASMALQNMLGLICDPVASRVEVPCLGKNVLAASNAIACANMAIAGFDWVIPLDETIAAAKSVSERMPREHRCTSLGGLAATPTAKKIQSCLQCRC